MKRRHDSDGTEWVAIILAIGIATAVNCITFAVLYDAIFSQESGLSENATQVLVAAFGGIIGVLGGYVGGVRAERSRRNGARDALAPPDDPPGTETPPTP